MNNTYFKPLFLLLGLLFVIGCQEDVIQEDIQTEAESEEKEITDYVKTNKTFTGSEARKKLKKGLQKMKSIGLPTLQKSNTADSISFSFGMVKTDKVVQTIDASNKENLVYDIELNDPDPKRFYNLVITTRPDGSESAYLFGYSMSDEFYNAYSTQGEPLSNFQGLSFSLNLSASLPQDCEDFIASVINDSSTSSGSGGGGANGANNDNDYTPPGGTGGSFGGGISGGSSDSGSGSSGSTGTGSGSSGSTGGGGWIEDVWDAIESGGSAVGDAAGATWDWLSDAAGSFWDWLTDCACKNLSGQSIESYNYNVQEIDPQVSQPIGEDPCAPVATAIIGDEFSNEYIANFILGIPVEDVILLQSYEYYDFYHESLDFLVENDFSDEALAFFREAFEAVKNGGEVDYDERIIVKNNFKNNDKAKAVYDLLIQMSGTLFSNIITGSFEGSKNANIIFEIGETNDFQISSNSYAYTFASFNPQSSNNNIGNRFYRVMLDDDFVENASTMHIAFALIHESIHAEVLERCILNGLILNINPSGAYTFQNYGNPTSITNQTIFNALITYYKNLNNGNPEWNHDTFTIFDYKQNLKINLLQINDWLDTDNSFENSIINDGVFDSLNDFYEHFTWTGLKGTQDYQSLDPNVKTKINYSIQLIDTF